MEKSRPNVLIRNKSNLTAVSASFFTEALLSLGPHKHPHPLRLQIGVVCSVSIDLRPFKAPNIQLSLSGLFH